LKEPRKKTASQKPRKKTAPQTMARIGKDRNSRELVLPEDPLLRDELPSAGNAVVTVWIQGDCNVTVFPPSRVVYTGYKVTWTVVNLTLSEHVVDIVFDNNDPTTGCIKEGVTVPSRALRAITCGVKIATFRRYPYRVTCNGVDLDPELDVRDGSLLGGGH
jgi:hypothetical protein